MKYPSTSENSSDEEIENILVADAKRGDFSDYEPDPDTPSDTGDFSDSMASDPEVSNNSTKNDEDPIPCTSRSGIETNINLSETNTSMEQTAVETDLKLEIDKWVVVNYEGSMFPGKIKVIKDKTVEVSVMQKSKKRGWRWPEKKDQVEYELSEVVDEINEKNISTINNRGVLEIKSDLLSHGTCRQILSIVETSARTIYNTHSAIAPLVVGVPYYKCHVYGSLCNTTINVAYAYNKDNLPSLIRVFTCCTENV